ncbi:hypothetical protein HO133_004773 [Letharia lupina]|uniref:Uncharacterized protein n=1 Tax=Letharia lupina TaxID=560253 RepID=A0A8H6KZY4_9LECA|nr:uncharacterized protein HO133_008590 [Letharia lupina]XP_037157687.1 uncharacterized protein HO133_004773 [Letharia lupina]KAF6227148.1 hypothetical protein HO133_008590 [Letharia lupina]KAF6230430.1 hypothetical protein HO133_004773 [Letharia lupina]
MVATPEDHSTGDPTYLNTKYAPTPVLTVPRVATRPHRPLSDPFNRPVAMPLNSSEITIPGFSAEQVRSITKLIEEALDTALDKRFGPLQPQQKQAVIPPKPAQPPKQEQAHRPLQQANMEKIAEKFTEKNKSMGSTSPIQSGTLSTIPHQATMQNCGDPSPRLSSNPLSTSLLASLLASQLASLLTFASPLGYIRFAKDMEAIGQG